jgi:uncharacterized protein YaiL (DUF2058 family)
MQSLRDKLLKAGLVSEDAAKKAEAEKSAKPAPSREERPREERPRDRQRDDRPRRPENGPRRDDRRFEERAPMRIPKLPPLPGSKEAHRQMSKRQLELDRTVREKVMAAQVAQEPGTTTFYFVTRKNKLRRLELTAEQAKRLEAGELAVVERPDPDKIEHALVPPSVAEEILALSPKAVRFLNKAGAQVGFLSESELTARASEATSDVPEENEIDPEEPSAPENNAPETFITIKRAPLT